MLRGTVRLTSIYLLQIQNPIPPSIKMVELDSGSTIVHFTRHFFPRITTLWNQLTTAALPELQEKSIHHHKRLTSLVLRMFTGSGDHFALGEPHTLLNIVKYYI